MLNQTKDMVENYVSSCSCCSCCSLWDTCNSVDSPTDKLVRDCFVGKKLRLSVSDVEHYALNNSIKSHLKDAGFIWLKARYKSGNLFNLYLLTNFKQDGSMYICDICKYQANFSASTNKVNIFIKGINFSMEPSYFNRVFGISVPEHLLRRNSCGLWTFKRGDYNSIKECVPSVTKSFGFRDC